MSESDQAFQPPQAVPPAQSPGRWPGTVPAPGYPVYPQGGYYGYPLPAYTPQGYPAPYPYFAYPPIGYSAPRAPRDTYRLVVGIICTVLLSITVIIGLLTSVLLLLGTTLNLNGFNSSLSLLAVVSFVALFATVGGGVGLYFTIRALLGRPSAVARPPTFLIPLGLTLLVLAVGVTMHNANLPHGSPLVETPLVLLSGILPAVTIFAFTAQRLGYPTTWRHAWLSFLSGAFLATLLALILELVASGILITVLRVDSGAVNQISTNSFPDFIAAFLLLSVVAPLAEEGFKPVGPLIIIGRIRGPAEAFLLGMASGIGFDIFETTGYISQGQADWISTAVVRVGAGLLHGVGAGMGTLGWYYLTRGKGVPQRWQKGFGALAYAVAQHGIFNGANFLAAIPGPIGNALQTPVWFFGLPQTGDIYLFVVFYAAIICFLLWITKQLRQQPPAPSVETPPAPSVGLPVGGNFSS